MIIKRSNLIIILTFVTVLTAQEVSFIQSQQTFPKLVTFEVVLGDVDDDGDLDAVFSNMELNHCQIWLNDGSGFFINSEQELTQQAHGAALGDLDGDGDLDLFVTCAHYYSGGWLYKPSIVYFNDGTGTFTNSEQDLGDRNLSGNLVDLIDIDNDKDLDAYVAYYPPPGKVYINDGLGNFTEKEEDFSFCICWGDVDLDGDIDYFEKHEGVGYQMMLNDGSGNFIDGWSFSDNDATIDYRSSNLSDIDDDGDLDFVVVNGTNTDEKPCKIFLNDGQGNFGSNYFDFGAFKKSWIEIADLNNDGTRDIFFSVNNFPNQIWLNSGNANFVDSGLRLSGNSKTRGSSLGDLDNDGDKDLFVGLFEQAPNEVWFNETITSVNNQDETVSLEFQLEQNYPNPFNPTTIISYFIPKSGNVLLRIYNVLGVEICSVVNSIQEKGFHKVEVKIPANTSGVYFYSLKFENITATRKMLLLK